MFDMRLRFPFTWLVTGGSGSGKTTMTLNFLRSYKQMIDNQNCNTIIYCYNEWQDGFEKISREGIISEWIQGLPSMSELKEKISIYQDSGSILVIDDFGQQITSAYTELFTVLSHHNNCSVLLLTQNLFDKNPVFRTISLNSTYISIFKNPRDNLQITSFARQLNPTNFKYIVESFQEATKAPHSYLFFDNHQRTPQSMRIRSNILPHEAPMKTWVATEKNNG